MSLTDRPLERVGWFGKIPALGDFLGRGLPASFLSQWDEWLSAELAEARELLADDWTAVYRQTPTLCFLLGPDVLDGQAWQGILLPSADRVGREFPLTLALCRGPLAVAAPASHWWNLLVTMGRQIRANARSADAVDEALAVLVGGPPPEGPADPDDGRPRSQQPVIQAGKSAWWPFSPGPRTAGLPAVFDGLPRGAALRALFGLAPV